jgi:hypothetical protein
MSLNFLFVVLDLFVVTLLQLRELLALLKIII